MPKLSCLCGQSISLHAIPNDHEFGVIPATLREALIDKLVVAHQQYPVRDVFERAAYQAHSDKSTPGLLQMIECPSCYRVAIFAHASDSRPAFWFQRERPNDSDQAMSLHDLVAQLSGESR